MFQQDQVYLVRTDLLSFEDLKEKLGLEVGVSRWFPIDQEKVDKFADLTEARIFYSFSDFRYVLRRNPSDKRIKIRSELWF
jgi:hypothetical protein